MLLSQVFYLTNRFGFVKKSSCESLLIVCLLTILANVKQRHQHLTIYSRTYLFHLSPPPLEYTHTRNCSGMRILVTLLLDTLPMLGNVLLLCFFVFFIFGKSIYVINVRSQYHYHQECERENVTKGTRNVPERLHFNQPDSKDAFCSMYLEGNESSCIK